MKSPDRIESVYDRRARALRERFFLSHQEVPERQYRLVYPKRKRRRGAPLGQPLTGWPHASHGAAVHPADAALAETMAREDGVPTQFDRSGRPQFTSLQHQRDYLRTRGMHNNDDNAGGR